MGLLTRGRCPSCRNQVRLRKDGTCGQHGYGGGTREPLSCDGVGKLPVPLIFDDEFGLPDCGTCAVYAGSEPWLAESVYSVSIETGGDPQKMMRDLLSEYHTSNHAAL